MPILRYSIHATLSLWILAAPAVQAQQQATLYVMGPPTPAMMTRASCDMRWRVTGANHRTAKDGYTVFLNRCLARCPDPRARDAQDYFAGTVRQSCAPTVSASQNRGIPQLIELATEAVPASAVSTGAGASTGVGASAGVAGGLGTGAIVGSAAAGAAAVAVAVAVAAHSDKPASP